MAFTYVAEASGYSSTTSGTSLDCSAALNVAAGDLIVAVFGWRGGALTNTLMADSDGSTNAMTLLDATLSATHGGRMAYKIAASADASATFRVSHSESVAYRRFSVYQFRPDSGETVTLDTGPNAGGPTNNATPTSGTFSTTGTDEIVVAGYTCYESRVMSSPLIAGNAADGSLMQTYASIAYTIYTSAQNNITAACTLAASGNWVAFAVGFKSAASAMTGTIADAQKKQTTAIAGTMSMTGALADAQKKQTTAITGTMSMTGTASVNQKKQTATITGTMSMTGTSAIAQKKQTTNISSVTVPVTGIISIGQKKHITAITGTMTMTISGSAAIAQKKQSDNITATMSMTGSLAIAQKKQVAAINETMFEPVNITLDAVSVSGLTLEAISNSTITLTFQGDLP